MCLMSYGRHTLNECFLVVEPLRREGVKPHEPLRKNKEKIHQRKKFTEKKKILTTKV